MLDIPGGAVPLTDLSPVVLGWAEAGRVLDPPARHQVQRMDAESGHEGRPQAQQYQVGTGRFMVMNHYL